MEGYFLIRGITTIIITIITVEIFFLPPPSLLCLGFPDKTGQRPFPNIASFLNVKNFLHSPPPPPPLLPFQNFFPTTSTTKGARCNVRRETDAETNTAQTMSGDCPLGELERVIKIEKPNENRAREDGIVFAFPKIP